MEIVSIKLAKFLKENGFSEPTSYYYLDKDLPFVSKGLKHSSKFHINHNEYDDFIYSAPSIKDAENWLTEKKLKYIAG